LGHNIKPIEKLSISFLIGGDLIEKFSNYSAITIKCVRKRGCGDKNYII
jgi:hypothetical protein